MSLICHADRRKDCGFLDSCADAPYVWRSSSGIFISSNLFGSVFQIASLPVVILAPLGAVSLLWNAFFARLILGDVFSPWMVISTLCIAGGAVLIAIFGIVPEPTRSVEDLLLLFNRPAFIVYFSLLGLFTLVCLVIAHSVEYYSSGRIALPADTPSLTPLLAPNTDPSILTEARTPPAADDPERGGERTPLLDPKSSRSPSVSTPSSMSTYLSSSHTPMFLAMSYASFSGIISGMCLLLAKSGVELLVLTVGGNNQFWRWQSWVLVLGLVVCALLQLWYMHKSLVLADPTLVCPLAFCFYNLSSIINGLVYFDQFSLLSTAHLLFVILGMTILLAGVWIVSFPPSGTHSINMGAWGEHHDVDSDAESNFETHVHDRYEDEPLPMDATQVGPGQPRNEEIGLRNVNLSQEQSNSLIDISDSFESVPHLPPSDRERTISHTKSASSHVRRQTESALHSSAYGVAPDLSHVRTTSPRRHRPASHMSHSQTSPTSPRQSFPSYPHPLSPGGPSGFSIGLSPVSPGFALVPRRRRVTSIDGFMEADGSGGIRRVVSDSGTRSLGRTRPENNEHRRSDEGVQPSGSSEADVEASSGARGRARGRWKWASSLLSSRKR
ncbi:hypothetical protein PHLCEN_2v446 [Hermanssonia centrifuga]|uniref:Uncharacterized protein n=1 Tax=Hermanssonia centrifuga TaxID=98765 RepID=A0A2R6S689_9APHY|nr:hypothetical protein PHLCEN_2v446 [Hermanssonia centrifuga]